MIAAGEVVERPASVVKELAENSVDAGARAITIEIKKGGMSYIRITDDGCGIAPDEVITAFKRHATSKIQKEEDLNAIYTLGFRGEALASVAAVSRVDIFTKTRESSFGYSASIEGGEVTDCGEAGCPDGTTITVRDLFYNTPARMKFLKNDATETSFVTDSVHKLILSHPEIAVKFIVNGKNVLSSPGDGKPLSAIRAVFGRDYISHMNEVSYEEDGIKVTGHIGTNALARKDRRQQVFFINGRYVRSRIISSALSEAYQNVMMVGKFPVAVLFLEVSGSFVDVNVHPTKIEVRFSDDKKVYSSVYWAVKNAISAKKYVPEISLSNAKEQKSQLKLRDEKAKLANDSVQLDINFLKDSYTKSLAKEKQTETEPVPFAETKSMAQMTRETDPSPVKKEKKIDDDTISEHIEHRQFFGSNDVNMLKEELAKVPYTTAELKAAEEEKKAEAKAIEYELPGIEKKEITLRANIDFAIVGQIFNTYIIVQKDDKMLIIDQHAAHERLYFEELVEEYRSKEIRKQLLLVPETLDLDPMNFTVAMDNVGLLADLGFECEEFGSSALIIRTAPGAVALDDIKGMVMDILMLISGGNIDIRKSLMEDVLHTMACRRALKGNTKLGQKEMEVLCEKVLSFDWINTCPHGRPIISSMSKYEIEKSFKRIV